MAVLRIIPICMAAGRAAQTLESISSLFTPQRAKLPAGGRGFGNSPNAKLHNQWPGTGAVGTPELTQLVASQGGSFGNGKGLIKDSQVSVWQKNGAEMLDKIGPAVIMTHSAGGAIRILRCRSPAQAGEGNRGR